MVYVFSIGSLRMVTTLRNKREKALQSAGLVRMIIKGVKKQRFIQPITRLGHLCTS